MVRPVLVHSLRTLDPGVRVGLSTDKMAKEMAKIIFRLIMILLNHDAMRTQNVIFIVKVKNAL